MNVYQQFVACCAAMVALGVNASVAPAANRTWIGGNADWTTSNANWSGNDEPDADDVAIFNTPNSVDLAIASQTILGLTMSGGIGLSSNGNDLTVNGLVVLSDASTDLTVGGAGSLLSADAITINSGAEITLTGGQITIVEESGDGLLDVNNGGELSGNGTIQFGDAVAAGTQLFNLDGTLTAHSTAAGDLLSLAFATLTINVVDSDGVIDLDGNDGVSTINVSRNDTLALNGGVLDTSYSGTINLSAGATFSRNVAWSLNGTLNANTGGSTAATIAGAAFTQTGGSINVDAGETLRISSVFHADDGVIANHGLIIFDNTATIDNASQFQTGTQGSIEVNNGEVFIHDQGWDWDGDGGLDNRITINGLGRLTVISPADNTFEGAMYLNAGYLAVHDPWEQSGGLISVGGTGSSFNVVGVGLVFSKTGGLFDVEPNASMGIQTSSVWSGGTLNVDGDLSLFNTATWSGGIAVSGNGAIYMEGTSVVAASTTINVNTIDWDGFNIFQDNVHTINSGAIFTLNINNFDADNLDNDMDDAIVLAGTGAGLVINGPAQWTMDNTLTVDFGVNSTIGGTSRMVLADTLNMNGHLTVDASMTFASGSTSNLTGGFILQVTSGDVRYSGGLITGNGIYLPGPTNVVQSSSTINTSTFGFDHGAWTVNPGATLTVDVVSYNYGVNTLFDNVITINSGTADVTTGDAEFVVNFGTINLNNTSGAAATWTGEPLAIGDDVDPAGTANLNVGGNGISRINSVVTFNSDADVNIVAGATLVLGAQATFQSVNGASNAEFTGNGTLRINHRANFEEATTLNMVGGGVDFDGENGDTSDNRIDVDAPLVIRAATFESFGETKMPGRDLIDVNNDVGAGSLTVTLDDPSAEWTLDDLGSLLLINDNTNAVLLAGSDLNLNGALSVFGEVQTDARIDVGAAGELGVSTVGESFWLNGGNNSDDPNTIAGGTISGQGNLGARAGRALHGFGLILNNIDFDDTANLLAQGGMLQLNGMILDVGTIGTDDTSSTLYVPLDWNTNAADLVLLKGGIVQGGAITNAGANGLNGFGMIFSRIVNSTHIDAEGGTLVLQTALNDNDWDGPFDAGSLNAVSGNLEIRDNDAFAFRGTVNVNSGLKVFANGFELDFEPGSQLNLAGGTYRSTNTTHFGGTVIVAVGLASLEIDGTAVMENGSAATLNGDLRLENAVTVVQAGAAFAGGGSLINPPDRILQLLDGANVEVLIDNQGTVELGASPGQVQGLDFQQDLSGTLEIELAGTGLNDFDRLTLTGQALLAGALNVSLLDGFSPTLGNAFTFISAVGGIAGTFDTTDLPDLATGLSWSINYNPTNVQLTVVPGIAGDYNEDGTVDAADYIVWRKTDGTQSGYDTWRAHFGEPVGGGAAANTTVPEPTSWLLLMLPATGWCFRQRWAT